mmetsp:Transcript_109621/g.320843  ORF Transcript_109621/g.320843 Transcript_109621/m.320843 type:complete len:252 (-) Transcript_109621:276-1031(-)
MPRHLRRFPAHAGARQAGGVLRRRALHGQRQRDDDVRAGLLLRQRHLRPRPRRGGQRRQRHERLERLERHERWQRRQRRQRQQRQQRDGRQEPARGKAREPAAGQCHGGPAEAHRGRPRPRRRERPGLCRQRAGQNLPRRRPRLCRRHPQGQRHRGLAHSIHARGAAVARAEAGRGPRGRAVQDHHRRHQRQEHHIKSPAHECIEGHLLPGGPALGERPRLRRRDREHQRGRGGRHPRGVERQLLVQFFGF